MPFPEHNAIRAIASHVRRLTDLTDDLTAVDILCHAANELHDLADRLDLNTRRADKPTLPFNPNPEE